MSRRVNAWIGGVGVLMAMAVAPAAGAMAVVDVRAIAQLRQQLSSMAQQLSTARSHLSQAQQAYQSMTGGRGMEQLLSGTVRNYLPPDWAELDAAVRQGVGSYQALAADVQAAIQGNAVLSAQRLALLSPAEREQVEAARRSAAMLQVMARQSLSCDQQPVHGDPAVDRRHSAGAGPQGDHGPAGAHRRRAGNARQ